MFDVVIRDKKMSMGEMDLVEIRWDLMDLSDDMDMRQLVDEVKVHPWNWSMMHD